MAAEATPSGRELRTNLITRNLCINVDDDATPSGPRAPDEPDHGYPPSLVLSPRLCLSRVSGLGYPPLTEA